MTEPSTILQSLAEQRALRRWRQDGSLDPAVWPQVFELLGPRPHPNAWRALIERLTAYVGALLVAAALICLIAYNWSDLSTFARLYGMQAVLLAASGIAIGLGPSRTAGRIALLLAAISIGGLFALIGQTYQTGADNWELFAVWAALLLPFALAGQWAPLWLLWAGVLNLALYLWLWTARVGVHIDTLLIAALMNFALLAAGELAARRWPQIGARYALRLVLVVALVPLTIAAMADVFEIGHGMPWHLGLWTAALAVLLRFYRYQRVDLGILAALCASGIVVTSAVLARMLNAMHLWGFGGLLTAMAVVGMSVRATRWLLRLRRENTDVE